MVINLRWHRANFIVLFVALSLVCVVGSLQAMTPAGTRIENRAQATYPWNDELQTTWSNWVTVTVAQIEAVDVMPKSSGVHYDQAGFVPAYDLSVTSGQRVLLPYRILNTGNATDTFHLDIIIEANGGALPASAFDPVLYHDLRGDGSVDPEDPEIDRITVASGHSAAVILVLRISPLAMDEEPIFAAITATSVTDASVSETNTWSRLVVAPDVPIITAARSLDHQRGPMWPPDAPLPSPGSGNHLNAETGDHMTHTITLDNMGYVAGTDIVLWEALQPSETLVTDSYGAGYPLLVNGVPTSLETTDEARARLITNAAGNQGIELRIPRMESTQRVIVEYRTTVDWQPGDYDIAKTAEVTYDERPGKNRLMKSNTVVVLRGQEVALRITPRGGSLVPGAPNTQHHPEAIAGQTLFFEATVHNTGRTAAVVEMISDDLDLAEEWRVTFYDADGVTPLIDTNNNGTVDMGYLAIGESRDLVIQIDVPMDPQLFSDPPYTFPITASFATVSEGRDTTYVQIDTVTAIEHVWDPLRLVVTPPDLTTPGSELTYSLYFGNASGVDAYNVTITKTLSEYLEPPAHMEGDVVSVDGLMTLLATMDVSQAQVSGAAHFRNDQVTGVYDPDQHAIIWTLPHVAAGTGGVLTFVSHVGGWTPEGSIIEVQGLLKSDETSLVAMSNVVTNVSLTDQLLVNIAADHHIAVIGDAPSFTIEVRNPNPLVALEDVQVHVSMPPGLSYRKGSSQIGAASVNDPEREPDLLKYTIPRIEKASTTRLTFTAIVNSAADYELVVEAVGMMETGPDEWGVSHPASVHLFVVKGILADTGIIIGRVQLDREQPGSNESVSQGVAGVRVVLDNGQYAVTDMKGRFSFSEIEAGARLLRLDPLTLGTVDLVPGGIDPGQSKTQRVVVPRGGIAMVDFVLTGPEFEIISSEHILEEGND